MQRRFRFPLERLQRVREIEESIARASWSAAERKARLAEDACEDLRREIDAAGARLAQGGRLNPSEVLLAHGALRSLWDRLRSRREEALTLRSQAERLAQERRARQVDVRACEKLRERAHRRHLRELERVENAELDEIALARALARGPLTGPAAGTTPASAAPVPMTAAQDPRDR